MIKFIITQGIGFTPGSVKYLPTLGFSSAVAAASPWVRTRQVTSGSDGRSVLAVMDQRGLVGIGDRRGVQNLN